MILQPLKAVRGSVMPISAFAIACTTGLCYVFGGCIIRQILLLMGAPSYGAACHALVEE